ncbi:MAG: amino acid ABC transporter permease [Pirellulaceae bacterium]|nr:MAG: amino acid ABC transporter permease [Pirellulaceae bacterium]
MARWWILLAILLALALIPVESPFRGVQIGSKKFTENVILGEMMMQLVRSTGVPARHQAQMGGSSLLFQALQTGTIDAYPDYTGTVRLELLSRHNLADDQAVRDHLANMGIVMSRPLGFHNGYALGMLEQRARELGIETISDLLAHPDLRLGLTNEFVSRSDGWPRLKQHYGLPHEVIALDHDIAYRQLEMGLIDVMDVYTTDAKIAALGLRILQDDRNYFPRYEAVMLIRSDLQRRYPAAYRGLLRLEGWIDPQQMIALNAQAEDSSLPEAVIAAQFLEKSLGIPMQVSQPSRWQRLGKYTVEHLQLVRLSLIPAILVGIPLGTLAFYRRRIGATILAAVGIIQTIPALALLVLLLPVMAAAGVTSNTLTAVVALFLYSLLPIVRGTYTGLADIDPEYSETAEALGMPPRTRLLRIELPLASRSMMAGIKTAAVMNIGFATLGALIGAGGYGVPVLTGIRRFDTAEILLGAVPAALLALACQLAFDALERAVVPRGLRLKPSS